MGLLYALKHLLRSSHQLTVKQSLESLSIVKCLGFQVKCPVVGVESSHKDQIFQAMWFLVTSQHTARALRKKLF